MQTVAVVGSEDNETNVDLVSKWQLLGLDACLLSPEQAREELVRGDIAVGRLDVLPTLDGIENGLLELLELRADGVRVVNSARALLNAHDKLRTAQRLSIAGVAHVPTQHVRTRRELEIEPPLVLKPRFGSWGAEVVRCDDQHAIDETFSAIVQRRWCKKQGA